MISEGKILRRLEKLVEWQISESPKPSLIRYPVILFLCLSNGNPNNNSHLQGTCNIDYSMSLDYFSTFHTLNQKTETSLR